jgi:pimeloyl-ACP methyl ester carboxylesterase
MTAIRSAPWDPSLRHRFVTSDGVALHVRDTGPVHSGMPTVVLIHGWTMDHTSWDRVADALPRMLDRGVRVLRFDHRGHGGSAPAPTGTATIARATDDLAELIADRVQEGPLVLAGHSMGGAAIMALAEQHPELVAKRVLGAAFVATTSGGLAHVDLGLPAWMAAIGLAGERRVMRRIARLERSVLSRRTGAVAPGLRWLAFGKRPDWADVRASATQVGQCHPASLAGFRFSLNEHERATALAAFVGKPTVVLSGTRDRLTPTTHARIIAEELPDTRLHLYPGAGHMLPLERSDDVAERIAGLIRQVGNS